MTRTTPPSRRLARGAAALGALLLTVTLTGCLKMTMDLTVQDQTVSGPMIIAIEREALEMMQQFDPDASPDDLLEDIDADLDASDVEGVTAEPYEDDRFIGTRYLYDNVPLDQLNEAWGDDPEALRIAYDPATDTYEVTGTMDLSEAESEVDEETEQFLPPGFMERLMGSFEMRMSITFPGEVLETTGEVSGTTVTWTPVMGERLELEAVAMASGGAPGGPAGDGDAPADGSADGAGSRATGAETDDGSSPVLLIVLIGLGVLALLGAVGLGIWLLRRSGGTAPAGDGSAAGTPGTATHAGAPVYGTPTEPTQPADPPASGPSPGPSGSGSGDAGSDGGGDGGGSSG